MGATVQPQSYCRACRGTKERETVIVAAKPRTKKVAKPVAQKPVKATKTPRPAKTAVALSVVKPVAQEPKDNVIHMDKETKKAMNSDTKVCTKCKIEQPNTPDFFRVRKDGEKSRPMAQCKSCEKEAKPRAKKGSEAAGTKVLSHL